MADALTATPGRADREDGLERRIQRALAEREESQQQCREAERAAADAAARAESLEAQLKAAQGECIRLRELARVRDRESRGKVSQRVYLVVCRCKPGCPPASR